MNDSTLTELKIVVERAVRPVWATMARKRTMREELLAHLVAIFEEDIERLGDERAALERAKQRFGDPKELTRELQQVVSRYDRLDGAVERYIGFRAGDSAVCHAARIAAFPWTWFPMMALLVPAALFIRERQYEMGRVMFALVAAHMVLSALAFALTLLIHGLRRSLLCEPARRSVPLAAFSIPLSAVLVPIGNFVISRAVSNDVSAGYVDFLGLCWSSLLVPVLLVLVAGAIQKDLRRQEEWASLKIGE